MEDRTVQKRTTLQLRTAQYSGGQHITVDDSTVQKRISQYSR